MSLVEKILNLPEAVSVIDNDFYTATLNDKGEWVYKAKLLPLKTDGKYKDVPRYPLIYQYEDKFKRMYRQQCGKMVIDIGKKLIEFYKKQQIEK